MNKLVLKEFLGEVIMWPFRLLIIVAVATLLEGCATNEKKDQAFLDKVNTDYIPQCEKSLGINKGQPITEEQRTDLKWCTARLVAKDELRNGSNDPAMKMIAIWIPNCESTLGTDWGEVGSEKREKLVACISIQGKQDLKNQHTSDQLGTLQALIKAGTQRQVINCYTYGNWTQCK